MNREKQLLNFAREVTEDPAAQMKYAEHLRELMDAIDAGKIGTEYKNAMADNDCAAAVKLLARYFRAKPYNATAEHSAGGSFDPDAADSVIAGDVRVVNIDWHFPDGDFDYFYDPTEIRGPRNHEWVWQLNRHTYWINMARTYVGTKDEKYAIAFEKQLLKWIAQTDIPEDWNGPGSAWRTIECGIRLRGSWQVAYDGFRRSQAVSDITLLLMLASMHRQAIHLIKHPTRGNWLMLEMSGAYTFSALFTEFSDSEKNRSIAAQYLIDELEKQTLPDGMHNELSPDYQNVVFRCASDFYSLAKSLGLLREVPQALTDQIVRTVDAAIELSTPALTQPRTNDCPTVATKAFTSLAAKLFGETKEYQFFNTDRTAGEPPKGDTASRFLPYAGFAVMRSDWSDQAAYLCFDVGPLGASHRHQDKLNINLYKGNEELLYDDGGGQYEKSPARKYAVSGYGHNTVLVDGMAQCREAPIVSTQAIDASWISNTVYDYAAAAYDDTYGDFLNRPAIHKREVRFCKPDFFCVRDTVTAVDGKPHDYEVLFHLDTTRVSALSEYENGVISDFGRNYELVIIPLDCLCRKASLKMVSAVTEPKMQGWYNGRGDADLHEAITVSREVRGVKDYQFTTLLFPVEKGKALPQVARNDDGTVTVTFHGRTTVIDIEALDQ